MTETPTPAAPTGLDGALVALVSRALHQRCIDLLPTEPDVHEHGSAAHDHGAIDVVAALRAEGWICTHREHTRA